MDRGIMDCGLWEDRGETREYQSNGGLDVDCSSPFMVPAYPRTLGAVRRSEEGKISKGEG